MAVKHARYYYILGVVAIIFGSCASIGIMTTFRNTSKSLDEGFRIGSGVTGFFATIVVGCQTFLDYKGSSSKHKRASDGYEELVRKIDKHLRSFVTDVTLEEVRRRYDDIAKHSPMLPPKFDEDLLYEVVEQFIEKLSQPRIPTYSQVEVLSTAMS